MNSHILQGDILGLETLDMVRWFVYKYDLFTLIFIW